MVMKRLSMRKCREILRLRREMGLSVRMIARSQGVARSTVSEALRRAGEAGIDWPLPEGMDEEKLEQLLYPAPRPAAPRPEPNWKELHRELRSHKHMTLQLLWVEYRQESGPDGYSYSRFCERYRAWKSTIDVVMHQEHRAGEKTFVDFAGDGIAITNPATGEVTQAPLFVGALGASSYTFARVCRDQSLVSWIEAHERMFVYFDGSSEILVPDNLKSAVILADRYEPGLNRTYEDMAEHYHAVVIPARKAKPRDKAKVESAVLMAERWIVAALRHRTFFSVEEANEAVEQELEKLNARPFQKLDGCRRSHYLEIDKPALQPLPPHPFEYHVWKNVGVNIDYHVEVEGHYYSVPYQLVHQKLEAKVSARMVEVFRKGRRVACHARSYRKGGYTTLPEHMPEAHRQHAEWTPSRIIAWAGKNGPATEKLVRSLIESKRHPQHGYRPSLGVIRLAKTFGGERLEAACRRALAMSAISYHSVKSILKSGLDRAPLPAGKLDRLTPSDHENVRGPDCYH
jgi:transposase